MLKDLDTFNMNSTLGLLINLSIKQSHSNGTISRTVWRRAQLLIVHYNDVIIRVMAFQITSLTIVYSSVLSAAVQRKHQFYASLAFVRRIHRWPVNSLHKWQVTQQMFPFDDVIMFKVKLKTHFIASFCIMICDCFSIMKYTDWHSAVGNLGLDKFALYESPFSLSFYHHHHHHHHN